VLCAEKFEWPDSTRPEARVLKARVPAHERASVWAAECASTYHNTSVQYVNQPPMSEYDNVLLLKQTNQLKCLYTIVRDRNTSRGDFVFYSDRIIRLLVEEGLNQLPIEAHKIETPLGVTYDGQRFKGKICGVSIIRAGESMEQGLRDCCRSVRLGKILIQRDEETATPKLFYVKLPDDISERYVLLLDPLLATGGSAGMAIDVLLEKGVKPEKIFFLNVLASPEGIKLFKEKYPQIKIVTGMIDECLNDKKYVVPGIGDFGDRYYCI
jgi:uracil phosphoribosyltransferase